MIRQCWGKGGVCVFVLCCVRGERVVEHTPATLLFLASLSRRSLTAVIVFEQLESP